MVSLTTDKPMMYSGTEAPCAYGELISIGARQRHIQAPHVFLMSFTHARQC